MASSWLDTVSCGAALVLATLAGVHAAGEMLQKFGSLNEASVECRDADATVIGLLRPLVVADEHVDTHIFKTVVTDLDLARHHCRAGESGMAMAIYAQLNDDLSRYSGGAAWPRDATSRVTAELPLSLRAAALRHTF